MNGEDSFVSYVEIEYSLNVILIHLCAIQFQQMETDARSFIFIKHWFSISGRKWRKEKIYLKNDMKESWWMEMKFRFLQNFCNCKLNLKKFEIRIFKTIFLWHKAIKIIDFAPTQKLLQLKTLWRIFSIKLHFQEQ